MTDKELLELAAKAEGRTLKYMTVTNARGEFVERFIACWNPLTDDGDALRLAVKLRLNLIFVEFDGMEYVCAVPSKSHQGYDEPMGDCEAANTRRAIVRAAAEIGGKNE